MADKMVKEESLTAIGDAIRTATGATDLLSFPTGMVEKIESIEAIPEELLHLTGDCSYAFHYEYSKLYPVLEMYGNKITTENLTNLKEAFYFFPYKTIPFELNFDTTQSVYSLGDTWSGNVDMFYGSHIEEAPIMNNFTPWNCNHMFYYCQYLKTIPDGWTDTWNWEPLHNNTASYHGNLSATFYSCHRLKYISPEFLKNWYSFQDSFNGWGIYGEVFYDCKSLEKINNVAVYPFNNGKCNNKFNSSYVANTCKLSSFTFDTNEDGSAKIGYWNNNTFDLTCCGYSRSIGYDDIFPADLEVKDDTTYLNLKNTPQHWTKLVAYSRYNHDSAVETINSLPDTSAYLATAGGTNTIKFTGEAGSATDGGAINTLTEEEIAVATAKGWTVSLV